MERIEAGHPAVETGMSLRSRLLVVVSAPKTQIPVRAELIEIFSTGSFVNSSIKAKSI